MKKSALSLTLLLLVGAGCLTSCNKASVKPLTENKKSVLFKINGESYTVDELLSNKFLESEEGINQLYKELEKTIIEENVPVTDDIKNAVDIKMGEWKDQVKSYAKENGLTERLAERSLLNQEGFDTRSELKDSYILAERKTKFYKDQQTQNLQPKFKKGEFENFDGDYNLKSYIDNTNPMVMSHILVKVESKENAFNQAEISESESDKLGTVVKRLAMGKETMNSFANVAISESQDESNAPKGGNLGIVDEYTSFVDEFKFGVYSSVAYNVKHNINQPTFENEDARNKEFERVVDELNLEKETFDTKGIYENIGEIEVLDAYNNLVVNKENKGVQPDPKKEDKNLYPRNQEFNEEFNVKGASYLKISPEKLAETRDAFKLGSDYKFATDDNNYVVDEKGNPIVVVRSEFGIHFISVTYNSLDHSLQDNVKYFMTNDSQEDDKTQYFRDERYNIGHTNESSQTTAKARKKEVEERVMNYMKGGYASSVTADELYFQYQVMDKFIEDVTIPTETEVGAKVDDVLNKFLDNKIEGYERNIETTMKNTVSDYVNKIKADQQGHAIVYKK